METLRHREVEKWIGISALCLQSDLDWESERGKERARAKRLGAKFHVEYQNVCELDG